VEWEAEVTAAADQVPGPGVTTWLEADPARLRSAVPEERRYHSGTSRADGQEDRVREVFDSSAVEVRRATAADAQAVGAVFDAAVRAGWTYLGELAEGPMFGPADWDRLVADHAPPNVLLVATDQAGRILGYTAAHPDDGEMFLLFVDPAYGGRGVGRMLLGAAEDALRAAGCRQAYLYTHVQNERARTVYASAGYRPDGSIRESDFNGTAIPELRLVKQL
jgi:ribosomal protein S18 acetylase RimI-like enzyme